MKLATIRRIAHHTRGDAKPLIPLHENALSGSAISVAPRFKRSSETNTQATLNPSCSHALQKPDDRFCIFLFMPSSLIWTEVETSLTAPKPCSEANKFAGHLAASQSLDFRFRRNDNDGTAVLSKLIRVRESL